MLSADWKHRVRMKLLVLSDLHLEFGVDYSAPLGLDYDVVILAGDIRCPGTGAVHWAKRSATFSGKPVVMVAGNHEFYGRELTGELQRMREKARGSNVHLLDRDEIIIDGVRFLGCTLWTDFQLPVQQPDGNAGGAQERSLGAANQQLNDFIRIRLADGLPGKQRLLRAQDTLDIHFADRKWLRQALAGPFNGPTVVVTHHAPAAGSVAPQYQDDHLTPAFVSDLPNEFFEVPQLWVHGHTHTSADYFRGACRILSNPRGYPRRDGTCENSSFARALIVDVLG